jgi:hypothetical protein
MAEKGSKKEGIKLKVSPWAISTLILLVILAIFLAYPSITGRVVSTNGATPTMSGEEVAEKSIDFINKYILAGQGTATYTDVEEKNGLYNIKLEIAGREYDSYATMDGSLLFPSVVDMTETPETEEPETQETPEVPKTDRPEVHAFVMSYCPYGLQFMKAYVPVIELLGDKADLELNFVHYIMHGEKEMTENTRMYCIQKDNGDRFTDYLRCFVEKDEPETCMADVGIDKTQVETCMQEADEEFEITKTFDESEDQFPPYNVDLELAQQFGVRGSPTFVINGQTVSVTRSAEAIKEAVCSAFNTPPGECETELSTTAEAPGIGAIAAGGGASSTGQC